MNRRLVLQAASALALTTAATLAGAQTAAPKRHKLILQVSDADPGKWTLALNNARNVQQEVGASNVDLEIVVYGPGIGMLKRDSAVAGRVQEATQAGVKVMACQNTMTNQKLVAADMNPAVGYVPAGVTELMFKQAEGWSYVRP
jgi:intracellular sulfur oxidation DsrE/DsrF family protein